MIKKSEYCSKVIETEFNKALVIVIPVHSNKIMKILKILLNYVFVKKYMKKVK